MISESYIVLEEHEGLANAILSEQVFLILI